MSDVTIKRALLSVSDKSGLIELGQALGKHGVELVSTGAAAVFENRHRSKAPNEGNAPTSQATCPGRRLQAGLSHRLPPP